jgi:hypothetical protein
MEWLDNVSAGSEESTDEYVSTIHDLELAAENAMKSQHFFDSPEEIATVAVCAVAKQIVLSEAAAHSFSESRARRTGSRELPFKVVRCGRV